MTRLLVTLALLAALAATPPTLRAQAAGGLTIAAASDLQTVLPVLTAAFYRRTGIKASITFGSSGNFFAQIQNGAPFDVFFSADADYPRRLASTGHVDPSSIYDYAAGRLVLWTRKDSAVDISRGLQIVRDARVKRVAIANPSIAPYGRAAVAALRSAKLYEAIETKIVFAENVAQAAQLADSGNADVALIGHGQALDVRLTTSGRFVEIPERLHPPIVQAVAIVSSSKNRNNASALLEFVKSAEARATFASFGFGQPVKPR
jgi:molybdate transport system substrate-binding protein